jgi:tRNA dimethylallyltransferase
LESKVVVIVGPTCSGKTLLALELAELLKSEIISADSRQIYKYLNIGTAKPDASQLKRVNHHFIDILSPNENFNASSFEVQSVEIIKGLHKQNKIPVVAGGSGLYIKAMIDGIIDLEVADPSIKEILMMEREEFGNEFLFDKLKIVDPESASTMLPQNWKRVIRALEVFEQTGKKISQIHSEQERNLNINFVQYGLMWERNLLYHNIEERVEKMISDGLVEETQEILNKGYKADSNSLNTVGYKEIISYLNGEIDLNRAIELIKRNTRRYAKRQMTWFRKDKRIKWLDINSEDDIHKSVELIYNEINRKESI